jgi:nucleoside 2-deoxyribosyltransferase
MVNSIYLIGSLRNPEVPELASFLRRDGYDVFDDWYAAGPEADDYWQKYETARGHTYREALDGYAARHVFEFDKWHLDRCGIGVLLMPAGKSGHLELGYLAGQGKPVFVLFNEIPARYDVMYRFAKAVCTSKTELLEALHDCITF